jgi:hypothetical protein
VDAVEFEPADGLTRKGGGRPPTVVPDQLARWLDQSYQTNARFKVPVKNGAWDDALEVVHLAELYCRRAGKSLYYVLDEPNSVVKMGMRDKRRYSRRNSKR